MVELFEFVRVFRANIRFAWAFFLKISLLSRHFRQYTFNSRHNPVRLDFHLSKSMDLRLKFVDALAHQNLWSIWVAIQLTLEVHVLCTVQVIPTKVGWKQSTLVSSHVNVYWSVLLFGISIHIIGSSQHFCENRHIDSTWECSVFLFSRNCAQIRWIERFRRIFDEIEISSKLWFVWKIVRHTCKMEAFLVSIEWTLLAMKTHANCKCWSNSI